MITNKSTTDQAWILHILTASPPLNTQEELIRSRLLTFVQKKGKRPWSQTAQGKLQPDIRKKSFTARLIQNRNQLPTEAAETPSLEIFKTRQGPKQTDLSGPCSEQWVGLEPSRALFSHLNYSLIPLLQSQSVQVNRMDCRAKARTE